MSNKIYRVNLDGIYSLDCFKEATKDELKVLVAISSLGGEVCERELADALGVSLARVKASIALFEEAGVLSLDDGITAQIEYEFDLKAKEKASDTKSEIAKSIRENDLYELNSEMERILEKTLATREIERITSLNTKKGLSPEYILTLAAFLKDRKQTLTVEGIVREASKLVEKDIDTLESLEIYIKEKNNEIAGEMEMRRLFGIYGRTLTKSEREHFKRWMHEFGYSSSIIGEAYDITVTAINKISLPYINSILKGWYDAGCKTVAECRARADQKSYDNTIKANNNSQKPKKKAEAEVPKYADFNSEDALMRALERSYGDDKD